MSEVSDIYLSDGLRVRLVVPAGSDLASCVVSFAPYNMYEPFDRQGFGEAYFAARGIAAIHIIPRENRWYQEPDLPAALSAARAAAARYGRAVAYGSSMGGFAAIRYGASAGAQVALAISPQFSIHPREAPFEWRWRSHAKTIRFAQPPRDLPKVDHVYLFCDPMDLDGRHAHLIEAMYRTSYVRLPYAGHPVGAFLNEAGLLSAAIEAVFAGRFDAEAFRQDARLARHRSGQYLFSLGHRLSRHHLRAKLNLGRAAVEATPADPAYRSFLAVMLELNRLPDEADTYHRSAIELEPDNPIYLERYARALLRQGRIEAASATIEKASRMARGNSRVVRTRALTLVATGQLLRGLGLLAAELVRHRRNMAIILREASLACRWFARGEPGAHPSPMAVPFTPGEIVRPSDRRR